MCIHLNNNLDIDCHCRMQVLYGFKRIRTKEGWYPFNWRSTNYYEFIEDFMTARYKIIEAASEYISTFHRIYADYLKEIPDYEKFYISVAQSLDDMVLR